jgi:hypothetical protein
MAHWVEVSIRGSKDTIDGPSGTQEEAERQLAVIRGTLTSARESPDLPWLAVLGKEILTARIRDDESLGIA